MIRHKAWLAWSSGKDSAWALWIALQNPELDVVGLLTTVTEAFGRVTMHGVREELVEAQAQAVGLPLYRVFIPTPCPDELYEAAFERILNTAKDQGVTSFIFGDLFLGDLRAHRERQLARAGLVGLFPLWKQDTLSLAKAMIRSGLRACLTCIDPRKLPREFCGAAFDESFLGNLPAGVDPCGENGEFHTFVWDGPMFDHPIPVCLGETVERDGFLFRDVFPTPQDQPRSENQSSNSGQAPAT